jgi:hypothetical protein
MMMITDATRSAPSPTIRTSSQNGRPVEAVARAGFDEPPLEAAPALDGAVESSVALGEGVGLAAVAAAEPPVVESVVNAEPVVAADLGVVTASGLDGSTGTDAAGGVTAAVSETVRGSQPMTEPSAVCATNRCEPVGNVVGTVTSTVPAAETSTQSARRVGVE